MLGRAKDAQKLELGFDTFCVHNNSKTDRDLTFSTLALCALEARLDPCERGDYLLVWRPMRAGGADAGGGALEGVNGDMCWRRYCHTQMAGIYRMLYRASVPAVAPMRHTVGGGPLPPDVARAAAEAADRVKADREAAAAARAAAAAAAGGAKKRGGGGAKKQPLAGGPRRGVDHVVSHDFVCIR
jgi:hypothetical protein